MAGKLIALESTNQQLLDKTAKYLALKLQSEGKTVEVLSFPQAKQSSGHFVQSHQKGEYGEVNPYAASMFYILDRYDASPQIRQYLEQGVVVICKSYRGTSLAKLGASISDGPTRKGFYIWADSLESGTFGVTRPDMAIVLSEELPTLYELCEMFPKDYVFAIDVTKVRNMLNRIIPPMPAVSKKVKNNKTSWINALVAAGQGYTFDFTAANYYVRLPKKSKNTKLYADSLHELEALREKLASKLPKSLVAEAQMLATPIGLMGVTEHEQANSTYKNSILTAQITDNFGQTYSAVSRGAKILSANPRNELDSLTSLLLPKTELSAVDVQASLDKTPIQKKIELFKAYLAGADNAPNENLLSSIQITVSATASYADLLQLVSLAKNVRFSLQQPTPRWGFDVPEHLAIATDEIEDCFASSLKLHSQLEAAGEYVAAPYVVLAGNFVQAAISVDGHAARDIAKAAQQARTTALVKELAEAIRSQYPLLSDVTK